MMYLKKLLVVGTLVLSLFLVACNGQTASDPTDAPAPSNLPEQMQQQDQPDASLADWDGTWRNMTSFLSEDDEGLREALKHVAEEHDMTVDEYIEHEKEESVPFEKMVIDSNAETITFYELYRDTDGKTAKYTYKEALEFTHGGANFYWYVFETKDASEHPIVLLMEIHGEENMAHFHVRAAKSVDEAMKDEHWYPTFMDENIPLSMIAEELEHHDESHGHHDHDHDH